MSAETKSTADQLRKNIQAETAQATATAQINAAALEYTLRATMEELEPKLEFGEVPAEKQAFSLGYACQLFQAAPPVIREIMKRASVRFSASVNDVPYIDGNGLLAMNRYLQTVREKYEDKQ
jgi:hypothetical protein